MFVTPAYAAGESTGDATHEAGAAEGHGEMQTETHADGGHGGGTFPPFDSSTYPSQLLWLAITFGLFYLFLKKVVLPRIGGILEVRRDRIAQDLDQAALLKEEADEAHAAYEQELASARNRAGEIAQKARDEAKAEAEAERARVTAELDKKLEASEKQLASIKAKAMGEVGSIAEQTATDIVKRLIGGSASATDIAKAIKAMGR